MEDFRISSGRDWRFWLVVGFAIVGALLAVVGIIGNWVIQSQTLGMISILFVIVGHWSFWLIFVGAVFLAIAWLLIKILYSPDKN